LEGPPIKTALSRGAIVAGYYGKFMAPLPVHFSMYGFLISIAAMVAVSLLTARPSEDVLDDTMTGLYIHSK